MPTEQLWLVESWTKTFGGGGSFVLLGTQSDWGDIWWTKGDEKVGVGLEGLTERQIVTNKFKRCRKTYTHEPYCCFSFPISWNSWRALCVGGIIEFSGIPFLLVCLPLLVYQFIGPEGCVHPMAAASFYLWGCNNCHGGQLSLCACECLNAWMAVCTLSQLLLTCACYMFNQHELVYPT